MDALLDSELTERDLAPGSNVLPFDSATRPFGFQFRAAIPSWDPMMSGGLPTGTPGGATSVTVPLDSDPSPPDTDDMAA